MNVKKGQFLATVGRAVTILDKLRSVGCEAAMMLTERGDDVRLQQSGRGFPLAAAHVGPSACRSASTPHTPSSYRAPARVVPEANASSSPCWRVPPWRSAWTRAGAKLDATTLAVLAARPMTKFVSASAGDPLAVLAAVDEQFASPQRRFSDVYDAARRGAKWLGSKRGARELVLVTLENGDVESDVDAAVGALRRTKVSASVITVQAFLSDTYWTSRASEAPRGMDPRGGEAAFTELPWGWLFQNAIANEHTGSGFATFGLSRLASSSQGRVFLFDDGKSRAHKCAVTITTCAFCAEDHLPEGTAYQAGRLSGLAPIVDGRKTALASAARDPYFLGTLRAWEEAADAGLVRSVPSVKRAGAALKPTRPGLGTPADLGQTLSFAREARKADKLARSCGAISARLREALDAVPETEGAPRMRANAETSYGLLRITRVNLLAYAAWCREVGPVHLERSMHAPEFPESGVLGRGFRPTGVSFSGRSLCHGVRPFLRMRWPGGDAFRDELEGLGMVLDRLLTRYAHTPYAMALRRSTLARFYLVGVGKTTPPPERERPDEEGEDTTTGDDRPERGGPDGGSGDGPSTGTSEPAVDVRRSRSPAVHLRCPPDSVRARPPLRVRRRGVGRRTGGRSRFTGPLGATRGVRRATQTQGQQSPCPARCTSPGVLARRPVPGSPRPGHLRREAAQEAPSQAPQVHVALPAPMRGADAP